MKQTVSNSVFLIRQGQCLPDPLRHLIKTFPLYFYLNYKVASKEKSIRIVFLCIELHFGSRLIPETT